jgi:hypothetical protein
MSINSLYKKYMSAKALTDKELSFLLDALREMSKTLFVLGMNIDPKLPRAVNDLHHMKVSRQKVRKP